MSTTLNGAVRELPAEQYDAIVAKANELGGVGGYRRFQDGQPWCVLGIAESLGIIPRLTVDHRGSVAGYSAHWFDHAMDPNRHYRVREHRVPILAVFAMLNIVRGPDEQAVVGTGEKR